MQYLHVRFFLSPELSSSMSDSNSNISTLSTVVHSTRLFDFHCQILDNISLVAQMVSVLFIWSIPAGTLEQYYQ